MAFQSNTRRMTILAQDPAVRMAGRLAFAQVDVPYEELAAGPVGYRVKVVDFDATVNVLYRPLKPQRDELGAPVDQFAPPPGGTKASTIVAWETRLLEDPTFHAQNVYAIVMRTLGRFEFALGRRVNWAFEGHQIHVAPHAFCEANAYYSEADRALLFGYFKSMVSGKTIFTCLSHDIVSHETTHALLDGIRDSLTDPSTPDQAAFHEGFADAVALLSVFSLREIVEAALTTGNAIARGRGKTRLITAKAVSRAAILESILLGLGKEFGQNLDEEEGARANCLRRSAELKPSRRLLSLEKYQEPHNRGEVFAAAVLRSLLAMWTSRIAQLGTFGRDKYNLDLVVEEGRRAADQLLTMVIRALDYCPPSDLTFSAFLSALLTADSEVVPNDNRYAYRDVILATFSSYGIEPESVGTDPATGCWQAFADNANIVYSRTHFESMLHDKEEVFRFLWENRRVLGIDDRGYLRVCSVRPSTRQSPDGFFLRETVCEYTVVAEIFAAEARSFLNIERPDGMPATQRITAYGGGTLIFDQYGQIKYHVQHPLGDAKRQAERITYLWETGQLDQARDLRNQFANIHRDRVVI